MSPSLSRLTEPLLDTPQTIIEVPAQQARDQGAVSLEDVVRYVPGISIHANEDTSQRNQFYVRGFSAETDRYLDGMPEIGNWYMDDFNMQRLEILEGPAGVLFGRGSTGGVVNYVSKTPRLEPATELVTAFGTDLTRRVSLDVDRPVDATTALRVNLVGYEGGVADRDRLHFGRFGIAPAITFGLGTDTRLTLSVLHQTERDLPDYGVPWIDIGTPGTLSRPARVPRHDFYGFDGSDFSRSDVNIVTARVEHDVSDRVTLRDQDNQSEALVTFDTWGSAHRAVIGLEFGRQTSAPTFFNYAGVPRTNLLAPNPDQPFGATTSVLRTVSVEALTQAAYLIDTHERMPPGCAESTEEKARSGA